MDAFRLRANTERVSRHTIFYLTEGQRWEELLASFPFLEIHAIGSELELKSRLLSHTPDLVLIESKLCWGDPVKLIKTLTQLIDVPTVMIYDSADIKENPELLKEAFAVGLHDTLQSPLQREDLWEPLDVLLKFRRQFGS